MATLLCPGGEPKGPSLSESAADRDLDGPLKRLADGLSALCQGGFAPPLTGRRAGGLVAGSGGADDEHRVEAGSDRQHPGGDGEGETAASTTELLGDRWLRVVRVFGLRAWRMTARLSFGCRTATNPARSKRPTVPW